LGGAAAVFGVGAAGDAFAEALRGVFAAVSPAFAVAFAALRAAVRRALERCGRVRGRLASTPVSELDPFARPLLDASLTRTSWLTSENLAKPV
jgi:hypothetical protein